jgi:hypothetical protein
VAIMFKFSDGNLVKALWAFSPALFGLNHHHLIHVGAPQE